MSKSGMIPMPFHRLVRQLLLVLFLQQLVRLKTTKAWNVETTRRHEPRSCHHRATCGPLWRRRRRLHTRSGSTVLNVASTSESSLSLPSDYQDVGNARIAQAAALCGLSANQLRIEWKADCVIITVLADNVYVSSPVEDGDDAMIIDDDGDDDATLDELEAIDMLEDDDDDADDESNELASQESQLSSLPNDESDDAIDGGIDMVLLTRAVNAALDDGDVGAAIAARFTVEVTTPGATDTLTTPLMFQAYQGFEVITQHQDPKTKSIKTIEGGRLVERNTEFLVLNIKGRIKKLKTSDVLSVRLPKAKKEKGAK